MAGSASWVLRGCWALVLAFALGQSDSARAALEATEYYPLNIGNEWEFKDPLLTGFALHRTSAGGVINGLPTIGIVGSWSGQLAQILGGSDSYSNDANGLRLHRQTSLTGSDSVTFSPPLRILPAQFNPGTLSRTDGTAVFSLGFGTSTVVLSYTAASQVEVVEQVTTPLGTFDAVRVIIALSVSGTINGTPVFVSDTAGLSLARFIGPVRLFGVDDTIGPYDARVTRVSVDADGDGVNVLGDNCPGTSNPTQVDTDADDAGDACDDDDDGDGFGDHADAFPLDPAASIDTDGDGQPDQFNPDATPAQIAASPLVVDPDDDGDGVDDVADAFPLDGSETADSDSDGMGDNYEARFGLDPGDASDAAGDLDADGSTNLEEFQAGRNPTVNEPAAIGVINSLLLGTQ